MFDWPKNREKTFGQKGFEAARRCCENSANTIGACGEVARLVATTAGQARPGSGLAICIFTLWIKIKTVGARRAPPRGQDATTATTRAAATAAAVAAAAKAIDECWRQMQNVPAGGSHETEIPPPSPPRSTEAR